MKLKLVQIFPVLILAVLFLSAFGAAQNPPVGPNFSVQAQETTVAPTTPPIIETVLVPVTGDNSNANNNATLLVYVLIGIAGLAFVIALVAILTRANPPTDRTHSH